jgi:hypothetical protein
MAFVPFTVAGQWRFFTSLPLSYLLELPKAVFIFLFLCFFFAVAYY